MKRAIILPRNRMSLQYLVSQFIITTFFNYAISSSVNFTSAWVKLHHNLTFTLSLKHLNNDANVYYFDFLRESSKESSNVFEVDLTNFQVAASDRYMQRIMTTSYNSMRTVKMTLTDCTHSDAGQYFCFVGRNAVSDCKFRLYILDLDAMTSTLGKDVKMSFDFSKIRMPKESISIMYGNMAEVISWREMLVITTDSIKPSVNPNFGREVHTIHEEGGNLLHVTLTDVRQEDSGFYACFVLESKEIIKYCGFELIIFDLKGISVLEDNNAVMFFYLNTMDISKDWDLTIIFQQEEHYTFTDMLIVSPDLSVEVSEAFGSRVSSQKKEDERLVTVTLFHVQLTDGGDYRCIQDGKKIPLCGYKLIVHVEKSQDSNQVNTLEMRDSEMVFRISPLVGNTTKVIIEFQHSSREHIQKVLTINLSDIKKSHVETKYFRRVMYRFEKASRAVTVRLKKVALADDGVYKCHVGSTLACVQKLNVFAQRIKHVIHKPWNIHEGESFEVTCDKNRFRYPADVISVIDMSLKKRSPGHSKFDIIASYKPNTKTELTYHGPTNRAWIPTYRGGSDPNAISLALNITGVIADDGGEYECDSYASTKNKGRIHFSLISWVTVKPKRATEAPQQATNAPDKPEENTDDLMEIYSYVMGDVTLTYHMKVIESDAPVVIIKFRGQGTDTWKNLLEITRPDLVLKRLTIDTHTFFSSNDNDSAVDLSLRDVSMEMAGLYRCFTEGLITSIIENCGYKLVVYETTTSGMRMTEKMNFSTLMTRTTTFTEFKNEYEEETTTLAPNNSTYSSSASPQFKLWDFLFILFPFFPNSLLLI